MTEKKNHTLKEQLTALWSAVVISFSPNASISSVKKCEYNKKIRHSNTLNKSNLIPVSSNSENRFSLGSISTEFEAGLVVKRDKNGNVVINTKGPRKGKARLVQAKTKSEKASIISSGMGDVGGESFGPYQLSKDTLVAFIQNKDNPFRDKLMSAGDFTSDEFKQEWKDIALNDGNAFYDAQHEFIVESSYKPILNMAKNAGLNTDELWVQQAIFSSSVQHSPKGNKKIIDKTINDEEFINAKTSEEKIEVYYKHRKKYAVDAMKANGASDEQISGVENRLGEKEPQKLIDLQYEYDNHS